MKKRAKDGSAYLLALLLGCAAIPAAADDTAGAAATSDRVIVGDMTPDPGDTLTYADGRPAEPPIDSAFPFERGDDPIVDGFAPVGPALTIADIEDASLFSGPTGERIGEVEDAVLSNGAPVYVVLDIGGFLGIGERTVAVPLSRVSAMRNAGLGEVRVYVNATREQLEALPPYGE